MRGSPSEAHPARVVTHFREKYEGEPRLVGETPLCPLSAKAEAGDDAAVALDVGALQVLEKTLATADQL